MMNNKQKIYIRLRHRLQVKPNQKVFLKDIAQVIISPQLEGSVREFMIHEITSSDRHLVVIDIMQVIRSLKDEFVELDIEAFGPAQCIIEIIMPRKTPVVLLVGFVSLLLFVGSGLAIMNFNEDVSMLQVHQKIYRLITGEKEEYPLLLQIPYSICIGIGMILFFNRLFKKRFNEEPSPLEVEMFLYQQNLDHYVAIHENKEVEKKLNDPH